MRMYIHTYSVYAYIYVYVHTYVHTYVHAYVHAYVHTYMHTYMLHTCIHTYVWSVHMYILRIPLSLYIILHTMVNVVQVLYKLSAVLSTNAVFHDCNSAINDVITRSQQVQSVILLFIVQVLQPGSGPQILCTVKLLNNGHFGAS